MMNGLPDECKSQYKQPGWMAKGLGIRRFKDFYLPDRNIAIWQIEIQFSTK
jgi:hypothetical protein